MKKVEEKMNKMKNDINDIIETFNSIEDFPDPLVYLFKKNSKKTYDELLEKLINDGYKLLNYNECGIINEEDYDIPLYEACYGENDATPIKSLLDKNKRNRLVTKAKIKRLYNNYVDGKSIFILTYNNMYLDNETLYESARTLLKDGFGFKRNIAALVLLDTEDNLQDFCKYYLSIIK